MSNNKTLLFLTILLITIIGVGAVSANNISDDNQLDANSADDISSFSDNSIVQDNDNKKIDIIKDDTKTLKESYDPYTKKISDDFSGNVYEINQDNYDDYFDEKGYLNDNIQDGDILDIAGTISDKGGININKAVNIISSNNNGMFENVDIFSFKHEGSYSNITDITVFNSKFFVENATGIIMNNVNVSIINKSVGLGTGSFSIEMVLQILLLQTA